MSPEEKRARRRERDRAAYARDPEKFRKLSRENRLKPGAAEQHKEYTPPLGIQRQVGFLLGYARARNQVVTPSRDMEDVGGILFLGFIEYQDQVGTTRNTAFLRQFDSETGRFNPIQHPDYEYQD